MVSINHSEIQKVNMRSIKVAEKRIHATLHSLQPGNCVKEEWLLHVNCIDLQNDLRRWRTEFVVIKRARSTAQRPEPFDGRNSALVEVIRQWRRTSINALLRPDFSYGPHYTKGPV